MNRFNTPTRRHFLKTITGATAAALASPALATSNRPDVIIGWTTWDDAEVVTKMAGRILRHAMSKDVELTLADINAQFRTIARGDVDVMMMSWEPDLHAPYLREHGDRLVSLGKLYDGTIGLAVPEWVPEDFLNSVEDLNKPEVQEALQGTITGIDPGAGLMATTRTAMDAYNLNGYTLQEGTGPSMMRSIARAQQTQAPIVVTAWRPHVKFALYNMRYLEDPQGVFDGVSEIHVRANANFPSQQPEIARMLSNMTVGADDIEHILATAQNTGIDNAIDAWIGENIETVRTWYR